MASFICLNKDRWVIGRCEACTLQCGIDHPVTQEIGTRLFGAGFQLKQPATGPGLLSEASSALSAQGAKD